MDAIISLLTLCACEGCPQRRPRVRLSLVSDRMATLRIAALSVCACSSTHRVVIGDLEHDLVVRRTVLPHVASLEATDNNTDDEQRQEQW